MPGYEDLYLVSSEGRIWAVEREQLMPRGGSRKIGGRFLATPSNSRGYKVVGLWKEGRGTYRPVHQLVLETFVGPRPKGLVGCHTNGNLADCRLENLRWDTPKSNYADAIRHNSHFKGPDHHSAKLSEHQARDVKRRLELGERQKDIGKDYGLCQSAISKIKRGKSWRPI